MPRNRSVGMATPEEEEFESKHDYIPGFLEALGELVELYEEEDDFRATSFRRAIIALEGQIITAVEDIKLFNLIELKSVGKSTLEMLEEFITSGKIEKLEEIRRIDAMPGFCKTLETAKYDIMDMYGLYDRVPVYNVKDLDKVKDKVKPEILEMFKEYIETKKIKKLAKTLCEAFIKNHEPLRYYFMKKPIHLSFDKDDPEWNYSGKAQKLDIVISCGFQESVLQLHDFEDILEGDEYDIDQLRNKFKKYKSVWTTATVLPVITLKGRSRLMMSLVNTLSNSTGILTTAILGWKVLAGHHLVLKLS